MVIGTKLMEARRKARLSQKELASLIVKEDGIPISPQYMNDIENGRRNLSSRHLIRQFARVLGLDSDVLYYWAGKIPDDILACTSIDPERIKSAFEAFRQQIG